MNSYTVKSGDNLSTIARNNGITLQQLIALNPQFASNPNLIKPGQTVTLSGGVSTPVQSPVRTQAQVDAEYASAAASHPALAGNSPEAIAYATSTGDFKGLVNAQGKPFSSEDQAAAVASADEALVPFYKAQTTKDTQDVESNIEDKRSEYEKNLSDQAIKFQTDKTSLDQDAADHGVLFSGSRAQKLKQLGQTYTDDQAYKLGNVTRDIGTLARNFGYNYGDAAANNLSRSYNVNSNIYNPNVATGGVKTGPLSSIYNENQGFQGTKVNTQKAEVQKRAASLLANKGNKLIASGYTNQL